MKRIAALSTAASLCMLLLSGCGLHPLYGSSHTGSSSSASNDPMINGALAEVQVDTIADRQGQQLRNELIDRLQGDGIPPPSKYELTVNYSEYQQDLGINNNASSTRGQLTFSLSYYLRNKTTGVQETSGSLQEITGYNIQYSEFSTIVSRDDAERRAIRGAADNMMMRLAFYFENKLHDPDRLKKTQVDQSQAPQLGPIPNPLNNSQPFSGQTPITQGPDAQQ